MYQRIMVPLDGSELAECVLPHVEAIAKGCQVREVVFVRVVETSLPTGAAPYMIPEDARRKIHSEEKTSAENYINQVLDRLNYSGVNVRSEIIEGPVAESLADYATKNEVDLIIIATHGRSGISRWVWGGMADRILRSACAPLLMVRAPGCVAGF